MKIKQNQTVNETNINQMSIQTPVKTGDTTFVDGLKDLDMANSMKGTLDTKEVSKNSVENKSETLKDDASEKINDFCQSNINYVSKNETDKKQVENNKLDNSKITDKDEVDKKETMPKMIMEEVVPEETKPTTPKASMEEFEYFEKSNNQFLALEQTIQTISELPKNNKNELKSEIKDNNKLQEHEEVQLSVEDFKPEEVKEQLKPQIDSLNSMKDISNFEDKEISKDFNTIDKKHDLKSEINNKNNNMLDKILNDDVVVDLVGKIPVMEEVVPKELRKSENKIENKFDNKIDKENKVETQPKNHVDNMIDKVETLPIKNVENNFNNKHKDKADIQPIKLVENMVEKVEVKPVQNLEDKVNNVTEPKMDLNNKVQDNIDLQPAKHFENKMDKAERKPSHEVENILNKDFDNKVQKNLEKTFEPKVDKQVFEPKTEMKLETKIEPKQKLDTKFETKLEPKFEQKQNINSKPEMKIDSKLEVKQQVEPKVEMKFEPKVEQEPVLEQKAENPTFEQKQSATPTLEVKSTQDIKLKPTTIGRTAVEPEKKQPLEDLNKFLTEIMSEDTVENLKSKDVSMIDDNTLLTEEIKNYYNLNKVQNLAATEDVKNVINERIAEIDDLAAIVETAQEAKSVQKELKSLDVQKIQPKKVETKQLKMTEQDANFFIELVKNNQETGQTATDTTTQILQDLQQADEAQQTTRVSKALADMIGEAAKTNKPFRIDFDKNISVIIKIDREGKISAEFLPGDKAVEQFLRTQLPMLRQKFNDENINYKDLNYRQSNGGRQNRERRRRGE